MQLLNLNRRVVRTESSVYVIECLFGMTGLFQPVRCVLQLFPPWQPRQEQGGNLLGLWVTGP